MDFKACAAAMITAIPEFWPSPWPGAPATRGRHEEVPGICEVPTTASMTLASRIVCPDLPQLARNAVGITVLPRSTLKTCLSHRTATPRVGKELCHAVRYEGTT